MLLAVYVVTTLTVLPLINGGAVLVEYAKSSPMLHSQCITVTEQPLDKDFCGSIVVSRNHGLREPGQPFSSETKIALSGGENSATFCLSNDFHWIEIIAAKLQRNLGLWDQINGWRLPGICYKNLYSEFLVELRFSSQGKGSRENPWSLVEMEGRDAGVERLSSLSESRSQGLSVFLHRFIQSGFIVRDSLFHRSRKSLIGRSQPIVSLDNSIGLRPSSGHLLSLSVKDVSLQSGGDHNTASKHNHGNISPFNRFTFPWFSHWLYLLASFGILGFGIFQFAIGLYLLDKELWHGIFRGSVGIALIVTGCFLTYRNAPVLLGHIVTQKLLTGNTYCNTVIGMANVLNTDKQIAVISALAEGSSIRSIERITGVHRDTIMRLGVKVGKGCAALMDAKMRDLPCRYLEFDEIWGFIGKKDKHVTVDDSPELGDVWTFCAVDAETKIVPTFRCGKRDRATANAFVQDVASRIKNRVQISTDGLRAYVEAIEKSFGADVDYAQIVKTYTHDVEIQPNRRYSAPEIVTTEKKIFSGSPDISRISTSYVERLNGTTRTHMRRLTRLTLAFSKKLENFEAAVGLHFAYYNFVKRHNTLRCTPAMAAGVERDFLSVGDLVEAAA
jgi:IS1 family transposase